MPHKSNAVTNNATTQHIERLPALQHLLLNKFYRSHASRMRASPEAEAWIVRNPVIIAGLCMTPVAEGYWLTGLFVAPEYRKHGVAQHLLQHIQRSHSTSPIWLFCHPDLVSFYQQTGFRTAQQLPEQLENRLSRYQKHKNLVAMHHFTGPAATD
jgi:N-acetylglutamate synthase-like GNAT family acetyltransferase